MGGKHKQANRTKNNARPSSSSHSAELLGNTIPTFFGFSSGKDGVSAFSGFTSDNANCSINSDFQIMFKQMNKKDPTTRYKGLQLFTKLCNELDANSVKTILPLWPRMYCTLCTDIDHKVREVAHHAHQAVVSKVKKMIAPYLKELAGPWFTSQYDTYAPAASAATLAFEEAFPSTKLNKAIMFCQEEILAYIYDNLINQTPQTLSNPNTTSPEDMQAKYERIIISSLQGYSLYLQKLSSDQIQEAEQSNKNLLSSPKFWKYSKNKIPLIRSCFFHTLIALCQNAKFLLAGESSRLSSAVFNNLDESDPVVLPAVWDAALNVLVTIEDCWSHINIEKQVFTKLCVILKGGGRNVSTIYPNILPLLSKLPEDMIKEKEVFYGNLFENIRCRLEINPINQSSSEGKIIVMTFIECLKYIIMRNSSDLEFCLSLILNQFIPALEQKLNSTKTKKQSATFFLTQSACLVHYWHSNRSYENSTYKKIVKAFFESLFTLYNKQLNSEVFMHRISEILNNQIEFLTILKNPNEFIPKSKGKVKFEEDAEPEITETVKVEFNDLSFSDELLPFVKKLVVIYFKNTITMEDKSYIPVLSKIVNLFDAKIIFEEMGMAVNESTCFKLFSSYFSKWLMNPEMECGELVDLSFSLLKFVTYDEKEYILEEFCNNWFSDTLQCSFCKALPNFSEDDCIIKWVRSERFAKTIIQLVERFVNNEGDDMTSRDIIVMLLKAKCANGEFIIDSKTSGSIMDIVSKSLEECDDKLHVIDLSHDLILNAKTEQISQSSLEVLVASLFKLWCYKPENEKLIKACETGFKIILSYSCVNNLDFQFTKMLSKAIKEIILNEKIKFSLDRIVSNINAYVALVFDTNLSDSCFSNSEMEEAMKIIQMLVRNYEDNKWYENGLKMIEKCCRVGYEGDGNLEFEYLKLENYLIIDSLHSIESESDVKQNQWENYPSFDLELIKKYTKWNLYVGSILNMTVTAHPRSYKTSVFTHGLNAYRIVDEEESKKVECFDAEEKEDIIPMLITKEEESKLRNDLQVIDSVFHESEYNEENMIKPLVNTVCDFLMSVGYLESFIKYYASTKHHKVLKDSAKKLKTIACELLKNVNFFEFQYLYEFCTNTIQNKSIWSIVKSTFKEVFNRNFINSYKEIGEQSAGERDTVENSFEEYQQLKISKEIMHRGNYFKILAFVEKGLGHRLSEGHWEQIFIYVHNFFDGFLSKSEFRESDLLTLSAVSRLYLSLIKTFSENHTKPNEERLPPETCLAWNEFVQSDIYNKFVTTWQKLAQKCYSEENISPERIIVLQNVSDVVVTGLSLIRKSDNLNESVELAVECGRFMTSPHAVIQITAFRLCLSVIPSLVKLDTEMFGNNITQMYQDTKEGSSLFKKSSNCDWTAKNLENDIVHNQGIVETLLSDFIVGDCCSVEPFTDSFTYTYSYLLFWCFLLDMCGEAHSPLRFQYGCWLQDAGFSGTLLESVFKLMPQTVLHGSEAKENCQKYFENYGSLDFREPVESNRIEQISCFVYRLFLQRLPNVVREWWNQSENKTSSLVEKVTRLYVSPILIASELKNVQQDKETGFDNMEVKTYPNSREVIATYTIDEVKMDLVMTLPQNYPLGTIKIESSNVVVSTSNWRNWLFHICKYLIHQNGTIWDALVIWKNNLDKKFEGVEECYICFSILQGSTFEIPRLCCHTCRKKFHSNCLYKWFSTSNNSTCPICRNLF